MRAWFKFFWSELLTILGFSFFALLFVLGATTFEGPSRARAASGDGASPQGMFAVGYYVDDQAAALRTGVGAADPLTEAGALATPEFLGYGRATIMVTARFTNAAQTCTVRWVSFKKRPTGSVFQNLSPEYLLTATAITDASGKFLSQTIPTDSLAGNAGRLLVTTGPGAGTVDLWTGSE